MAHADLIAVQQFEFACAFIVVVLDADASSPLLDFAFRSPDAYVHWLGAVEQQSGG